MQTKKLQIEYKQLSELTPWDKNPRGIKDVDFKRLVDQIQKHGVYKPLIVNQDYVVIGGNMRYRALSALKITSPIAVSVVQTKDEKEMLEISLSDNDRAGYYEEQPLAELSLLHKLDTDLYTIDLGAPRPVSLVVQNLSPEDEPNADQAGATEVNPEDLLDNKKTCTCPRCGFEFEPKDGAQNDEEQ